MKCFSYPGAQMGRRLVKDRLIEVSSFAGSFDVSGPLACFSIQVIDLSQHPSINGASRYFLERFELIVFSGYQRRPCYQVCRSFLFSHPPAHPSYRHPPPPPRGTFKTKRRRRRIRMVLFLQKKKKKNGSFLQKNKNKNGTSSTEEVEEEWLFFYQYNYERRTILLLLICRNCSLLLLKKEK